MVTLSKINTSVGAPQLAYAPIIPVNRAGKNLSLEGLVLNNEWFSFSVVYDENVNFFLAIRLTSVVLLYKLVRDFYRVG